MSISKNSPRRTPWPLRIQPAYSHISRRRYWPLKPKSYYLARTCLKSPLAGAQKRPCFKNGWLFLMPFFAIVYCSVDSQNDSCSSSQQTFASREKLPFCGSRPGYFMQLPLHPSKRGSRAHGKFFRRRQARFKPERRRCELIERWGTGYTNERTLQ
jgi:hypothetical protein